MKSSVLSRAMRVGTLLIALAGIIPVLYGQDDHALKKLSQRMSDSCVELVYRYSYRKSGVNMNGEGQLVAQGMCWTLKGNGIEMYCDSTAIWMIDPSMKEVVIEPAVSVSANEYEANPAILLLHMDDMFRLRDTVTSSDGKAMVYILDPVTKGTLDYLNVEILKSEPVIRHATVALKDGDLIKIEVSSMKLTPLRPVGSFRPQRVFDSSWIVTDLR